MSIHFGLTATHALDALGQSPSGEIRSVPSCATCVLQGAKVVVLGTEADSTLLGGPPLSVLRDAAGSWWVSVYKRGEPIHVFDAAGRLRRVVGSRGGGPGEFIGPLMMSRSKSDSIFIHDPGAGRLSVVHASSPTLLRSHPLPIQGIEHFAAGPDGTVIVNAHVSSAATVGFPLHILGRTAGSVSRSFGAVQPTYRHDLPRVISRRIVFADADHIWSILPTRYEIERWNVRSGARSVSFTRRLGSFAPHWLPEVVAPDPSTPPAPYVVGAGVDSAGRLWVYSLVADAGWRAALGPKTRLGDREFYPLTDVDRYYDTLLEVIDLTAGRLVASTRVDPALPSVVDHAHAAGMEHNAADSGYLVAVWRFTLDTQHGGAR